MFFEDCGEDSVGRGLCDHDSYALGLRKKLFLWTWLSVFPLTRIATCEHRQRPSKSHECVMFVMCGI